MTVKYYYTSHEAEGEIGEMLAVNSSEDGISLYQRENGADWIERSLQALGIPKGTKFSNMESLGFTELQKDDLPTYSFDPADFVGVEATGLTEPEIAAMTAAAAKLRNAPESSSYLIPAVVGVGILFLVMS